MFNRRLVLATLVALPALAAAGPAFAADQMKFTQQAFDAAQKAGQPILVEITASWCPTCRAQKKVLSEILPKPEHDKLAVFEVDFDTQKDVVRAFNARMQSTLISFKGAKETGRLVGVTKADAIQKLVDATL